MGATDNVTLRCLTTAEALSRDPVAFGQALDRLHSAVLAKIAVELDTIQRGQNANKSLSNTGGNAGDGDITGEMLLKMPMDEFEAWCTKHPAKAKRLMGG